MERRSTKRSIPRKRYTNDAFEGVEELEDARSDREDIPEDRDADDSADEFEAAVEQSQDEDEMSGVEENLENEAEDADENAGESLLDDAESIAEDPDEALVPRTGRAAADFTPTKPRMKAKKFDSTGSRTYNRGVDETAPRFVSKDTKKRYFFGAAESDYKAVEQAGTKWTYDPTFPSRVADSKGFGGMHRSFFEDANIAATELQRWKSWWYDGSGQETFTETQVLEPLNETDAVEYMPMKQDATKKFIMGPLNNQSVFDLGVGQSVALQAAWSSEAQDHDNAQSSPQSARLGYMLNLGARIQYLDWASSQNSQEQYLAVSVSNTPKAGSTRYQASTAPAFTPQPTYKSNVQIWKFRSTNDGRIDMTAAPRLQMVLCLDWGDVKTLKWCLIPDDTSQKTDFGLLAGIWTDGTLRVLQVPLSSTEEPAFLRVKTAAFESRPPNTVCTCLTWVSATRIAAGCANGCIAVWDLPNTGTDTKKSRPSIYSAVSTSYILSIASCSPSQPNLILASSMSGFITMSDLSRAAQGLTSQASTVLSNRNRVGVTALAWHDFMQTCLQVDDNFTLRGALMRRLFATFGLARYKSSPTCVVTSPCHPFVLVGTASGEVVSSNPMKRVVLDKPSMWQQTWFTHEWRRSSDRSNQNVSMVDHDPSPKGISRILEGFKAERIVLDNTDRNIYSKANGVAYTTIYEEESAITALAWNPNLHVGGWAAAGMGVGLLRVEDVALDVDD